MSKQNVIHDNKWVGGWLFDGGHFFVATLKEFKNGQIENNLSSLLYLIRESSFSGANFMAMLWPNWVSEMAIKHCRVGNTEDHLMYLDQITI